MARIRSIKPEFWTSEQVMECSLNARLLFIGLWNFADDCGRLPLSPRTIKAQVFPGDEMSSDIILGMVYELSLNGLLLNYAVDGKEFLQITGWQHQRIDKPQPAKYPAPIGDYSKTIPRTLPPDRKGEDRIGRDTNAEANASGANAPTDHRKRLFDEGLKKLAGLTGKGPDACRSFVGKCLKAASDDAVTVLGLIEDADRNRVVDPSAWISARLKATGPPGKPLTEYQRAQHETKGILDGLENFARSGGQGGAADIGLLPDHSGERSPELRGGPGQDVIDLPRASYRAGD